MAEERNSSERRRHRVFITRNTEYHLRDRECVGVRDSTTGRWIRRHKALRAELLGSVDLQRRVHRTPRVGARLIFAGKETVVTSRVLDSLRPDYESTFMYASLVKSGEIEVAV
jgi:hypothetical protein